MTATTVGLLAGLLLGVAAAAGGFWGFLITLVLGAVGLLVGRQLDGELDLGQLLGPRRRG
jgi:uncharacterized membrane protein YeaQ/YmgE (transglycosylase-associated protein family)